MCVYIYYVYLYIGISVYIYISKTRSLPGCSVNKHSKKQQSCMWLLNNLSMIRDSALAMNITHTQTPNTHVHIIYNIM
jgi:hypothetical protein